MFAFGLLGAVGAHTVVFGGGHQLGGTLHGELIDLLFAAAAFAALIVISKALCGDRHCADGSAIAASLRSVLPSIPATILTAGSWFAAIESCERTHAMPILTILGAIVAVCAVLVGVARLAVRALRAARLLFIGVISTQNPPTARLCRRASQPPRARSVALRRHLFSRPPPVTA